MSLEFGDITDIAVKLVGLSTELVSNPDRKMAGGIITWAPDNLGSIHSARVGDVSDSYKWDSYRRFSQEKVYRTHAAFLISPDTTISSWQTRDKDEKKYGGAILFDQAGAKDSKEIISFSGLKEPVDEAVSLVIGHELRHVSDDFVRQVIEVSGNEVYHDLLQAYRDSK